MSDILASTTQAVESAVSTGISNLKLEKAYLLVLPPQPIGFETTGAIAGEIAAAEAIGSSVTGGVGSLDSNADSVGGSGVQQAETVVGGNTANKVTFLFNPQSYTISKSANWHRLDDATAWQAAVPQWRGAQPRSMSVSVMLDASYSENGGIQADVDLLFSCCQPTLLSLALQAPSPPFVMFGWGIHVGFLSYMRSVNAEYTLFRPDGTPLRATCSLEMEEIPYLLPSQNPTSGGRPRRTRTVIAGDTLQSIARREYGKPTMWRAIAHANGIEDPLRLAPGTTLFIPPLADAAALA